MRRDKTIDLGFEVPVSHDGDYIQCSTVTVRAPGFNKFDVHTTMQQFVSKAVLSFAKMRGEMQGDASPFGSDEADSAPDASEDEQDVMTIMAMGLGDDYPRFAAYVAKALTNSKLATIGDGHKITDEVWQSIEEAGDIDAAMRVMSEFTGFFFESLSSKKKTGGGKSRGSSSPTKAGSGTKKRETTPG